MPLHHRRTITRNDRSKFRAHRQRTIALPEQLESRQLLAGDVGVQAAHYADSEASVSPTAAAVLPSPFMVQWKGRQLHAVPGEFLFQFNSKGDPRVQEGWSTRSLGTGTWLLKAPGASESQIHAWTAASGAIDVEPNYLLKPLGTPIDPEYPNQWHLPRINAPAAWDTTNGTSSVVVAILDSGIDYDHPDFSTAGTTDRKNIWQNPKEILGNGIDDDGNGWTDDFYGYDFGAGDSNPMDDDPARQDREDANIAELGSTKYTGHGTAVAGVMGAVAGTTAPQQMVAGVNWDIDMMALKITRPGVGYVLSAAVEAYKYLQKMKSEFNINIVVANCSWGTYDDNVQIRNLEKEIETAGGRDILTVAAAGDSGISIDATPFYPAAFPSDYVLSVAATNRDDSLWNGSPDWAWADNSSNYGFRNVDVAAPGKQILTTISKFAAGGSAPGGTGNWEGTSMAAGIVSGVAALMKAASPTAPALALKQVIINTVQKVVPLRGLILSEGIVNAEKAIAEILLPSTPQIDILHLPGQENGVREGHTGFTSAIWQIRVKGPLDRDPRTLYVDYRTVDNEGSATPDGRRDPRVQADQDKQADYVPVIGTMAFVPGPRIVDRLTQVGRATVDVGRIRSVPVRVFGDRNVEPSETMRIRIDRAYYKNQDGTIQLVNGFILTRTNDFTIITDDISATDGSNPDARTPSMAFVGNTGTGSGPTVEVPEGDTGTSIARFPLQLSIPTTSTVTVRYRTRDLDGRAGVDYVAKSGMVTFRPNQTLQYIDIPVLGNRRGEGNRSFLVELTDPKNVTLPGGSTQVAGAVATGVIIDDDPIIRIAGAATGTAVVPLSVAETRSGTSLLTVTLNLSQPVQKEVTVRYVSQNLSARAGQDYIAANGTAYFAKGASSTTFSVTILGDTFVEGDENFLIRLDRPTNASLLQATINVTISDAGAAATTNTTGVTTTTNSSGITLTSAPVTEGNSGRTSATFTVALAAASATPVTLSYATANGSAFAGRDYLARSGTLRFAPGETMKTVTVPVLSNTKIDGNRTFDLVLSSGIGSTQKPVGRFGTTIIDDDGLVARGLAFASVDSAAAGTTVGTKKQSPVTAASFAAAAR
jgi:subtilisin family serine protease